jgi:hypothetical protein
MSNSLGNRWNATEEALISPSTCRTTGSISASSTALLIASITPALPPPTRGRLTALRPSLGPQRKAADGAPKPLIETGHGLSTQNQKD